MTASDDKLRDVQGEDVNCMTENGWADRDVHFLAFQSLVRWKKLKGLPKMLLYLDGGGEALNVDGLTYLASHDIAVVVFPPGTSSRLQPCDTCFFGVLKKIMSYLASNDGVIPSQTNALFYWYRALKYQSVVSRKGLVEWILSAWRKAGLIPFTAAGFDWKEMVGAGLRLGRKVTEESWEAAQAKFALTPTEQAALLEQIRHTATVLGTVAGQKQLARAVAAFERNAVVNAADQLSSRQDERDAKEAEKSAAAARAVLRKAATAAKKAALEEKRAMRALEEATGGKSASSTNSAISSSAAASTASASTKKRKRSASTASKAAVVEVPVESVKTTAVETDSRYRRKKSKVDSAYIY